MKILFLTRYSRRGASSRYRSFQFLPWFKRRGVDASVSPFFSDSYLTRLYESGTRMGWDVVGSYWKRFRDLLQAPKYDLLVLEKELFPYVPSWFEETLKRRGVRLIADYDDAVFLPYQRTPFLSAKISRVAQASSAVTVGNDYLAGYFREFNARVYMIPTVVDLVKYPQVKAHQMNNRLVIGWMGTPKTVFYLHEIRDALAGPVQDRSRSTTERTHAGTNAGEQRHEQQRADHQALDAADAAGDEPGSSRPRIATDRQRDDGADDEPNARADRQTGRSAFLDHVLEPHSARCNAEGDQQHVHQNGDEGPGEDRLPRQLRQRRNDLRDGVDISRRRMKPRVLIFFDDAFHGVPSCPGGNARCEPGRVPWARHGRPRGQALGYTVAAT